MLSPPKTVQCKKYVSKKTVMKKAEILSLIILFLMFSFYCILFYFLLNFIQFNKPYKMIAYLLGYIMLLIIMGTIEKHYPNKFIKAVNLFIAFPSVIFKMLEPLNVAATNILFYFVSSFIIPLIIYHSLTNYLPQPSRLFILLVSTTIISVVLNKSLIKFILKFSPAGVTREANRDRKLGKIRLTYYILRRNSITFYIYLGYFLYLFFYSLNFLSNKTIFITQMIDNAVMQAFFVFLAFDNLKINVKIALIKPTMVLSSINSVTLH